VKKRRVSAGRRTTATIVVDPMHLVLRINHLVLAGAGGRIGLAGREVLEPADPSFVHAHTR
jgi:hypothetical protein